MIYLKITWADSVFLFQFPSEDNQLGTKIINVLAYVQVDPQLSIRNIYRDLICVSLQYIELKKFELHPYHALLHQRLTSIGGLLLTESYVQQKFTNSLHKLWTSYAAEKHYLSETNPFWMKEGDHEKERWCVDDMTSFFRRPS